MPAVCRSVSVDDDSVTGAPNAGKCDTFAAPNGSDDTGVLPADTECTCAEPPPPPACSEMASEPRFVPLLLLLLLP